LSTQPSNAQSLSTQSLSTQSSNVQSHQSSNVQSPNAQSSNAQSPQLSQSHQSVDDQPNETNNESDPVFFFEDLTLIESNQFTLYLSYSDSRMIFELESSDSSVNVSYENESDLIELGVFLEDVIGLYKEIRPLFD